MFFSDACLGHQEVTEQKTQFPHHPSALLICRDDFQRSMRTKRNLLQTSMPALLVDDIIKDYIKDKGT